MNSSKLKIHLAQINTSIGDLEGNKQKILNEFAKAEAANCDLAVFCEMTLCGYPCEDLWQKKYFIAEIEQKIIEICEATKGAKCAVLIGAPTVSIAKNKKEIIHNSALLIEDGKVKEIINKKSLPNYGVFDEKRYFTADNFTSLFEFRGLILTVLICEDFWEAKNLYLLQEQDLDLVVVVNASPYSTKKLVQRLEIAQRFVKNLSKPLLYLNQVGAQDAAIFDGSSFVLNDKGEVVLQMKEFAEDSAMIEIGKEGKVVPLTPTLSRKGRGSQSEFNSTTFPIVGGSQSEFGITPSPLAGEGWGEGSKRNYQACILGLRDYIQKNNFQKVLLGMSGGIDSALVAAIATDALGSENVSLCALPSRYNSEESMLDATVCAKNLKINLEVISIEKPFEAMKSIVKIEGLAEENLQSRIRGNILMALSNQSGALLLSTGNKSELAVGYATIYGDMCGAFNPIKDLYKTEVFELAKWRNQNIPEISVFKEKTIIPQNILTKAPTAELRPNQKDSDSLPEYDILDKILFALIEEQKSIEEIIAAGFAADLVKKVAKLLYRSEYKRQQAVIGPKISEMSFDKDRRYPITNHFTK